MSIALDIRPPLVNEQQYRAIHNSLNEILNIEQFGKSGARITPRLDQGPINLPLERMWIITRENYVFDQARIDLLFELLREANIPHALKFAFQT
ncbi:MAG: hypothetical protein V1487_03485 [bacterium]